MANGAFKFKDNYGNVVSFISGSGSNIIISGGTLDLSGMAGLTMGNITMSGTTQNATSASHAASYLLTSSFNTYSGTTDTIIGSLQTSTGSLNSFTSSATTRLNSIEGKTGSYATTGSNTFNGNLTVTGYIDAQELRTTYISSSILYRSGSTKFGDELTDTHAFTGSLLVSGSISVPGSNLISGSAQVDVMSTTNIARLATTGSNSFTSNQIVTGSITNRGVVIDGANNANVAKLNFTRTDNSWGIHNETNLRIYVGSGNTTSPGTQVVELTTGGSAIFAGTITSQVNGSTFGTASSTGRAVVIQGGSANQVIQFKNAAGGDATLYVEGTSSAAHYRFDTYSTSNAFFIANGGNIAINNNNPSDKLDVYGDIRTSVNASYYAKFQYSGGAMIRMVSPSSEVSDCMVFRIEGGSSSTTGNAFVYQTQAGNTTPAEVFKISKIGDISVSNTGISNSSGLRTVSIYGSATDNTRLSLTQIWNGNLYPVHFIGRTSSVGGSASNGLSLQTSYWNGSSVTTTERFAIDGYTGDVSINTKLYVGGPTNPGTGISTAGSIQAGRSNVNFLDPSSTGNVLGGTTFFVPSNYDSSNNGYVRIQQDGTTISFVTDWDGHIAGGTLKTIIFKHGQVGNGVQLTNGATSWSSYTSDARTKTIHRTIENTGLETISKLNGVVYTMSKVDEKYGPDTKLKIGFTAQNVQEAIPEAVFTSYQDEELGDVLTYTPDYIIPYLVESIKELKAEIEILKNN